jgi:hypothetical protein
MPHGSPGFNHIAPSGLSEEAITGNKSHQDTYLYKNA